MAVKRLSKNVHKLVDIFIVAICGIIAGANSWTGVAAYGEAKQEWLSTFLDLENGTPSHDTVSRFFSLIDPEVFQACFVSWIQAVAQVKEGELIAIDGKRLRRSYDKASAKAAIHIVSA